MGKNTDKLGKIETFKAPWETDAGETEIDKTRLKSFIYNLSLHKAKAEDAAEEAAEQVVSVKAELDTAKADVAKGDSTGKIAELEKKLTDAEAKAKDATVALDRYTVAVDKGLTPQQAEFLQGSTKDELEKSADKIAETFGIKPATQETDEEREEREEREQEEADEAAATARQTPAVRQGLVNPADPAGPNQQGEPDYDKLVDGMFTRIRI